MKILLLSGFLIALSISGVSIAEGHDDETTNAAFEFAFMVFDEFRITPEIGVVYQPVFSERFGHPERTTTEEGYDDPTYKQIWETLYYDGVEITISRGAEEPPSGWTWLNRVRITNPKYALRHGLRIGDPVKKYEETLGPWRGQRSTESAGVSFYAGGYGEPGGVTHGAHATVTLELDNEGAVTAVEIKYWAD